MARRSGSQGERTEARVRACALQLFAQSGYAAVSMRQIAREVGVQVGTLYLYTPDKQSLLHDLMRSHMAELLAAWAGADPGGAPGARLEAFVRFHIRHHLPRADAVFVSYMELRNLEPANFAAIEAMRRSYEAGVEAILAAGQGEGVFRLSDSRLTTLALIAMLNGVFTWYRDGGRLNLGQIEEIYLGMVRGLVGADA